MRERELPYVPVWFETRWGLTVLAVAVCLAGSVLLYSLSSYIFFS